MSKKVEPVPLRIVMRRLADLRPYANNPRQHSPKQVRQIADSMARFGCNNPIQIDGESCVLAGHGRLAAAKLLGLAEVPTISIGHLSPAERRAYIIADNRLGDLSRFDRKLLAKEVALILDDEPTFDLEITGFDAGELEILHDVGEQSTKREKALPPPDRDRPALTQPGDLWVLGKHRLFCGDALERDSFLALMSNERARMVFGDLPYNVKASSISGKGRIHHGPFAMASGELSSEQFAVFLTQAFALQAKFSVDGSLHYQCMDWRHQYELLTAGKAVYDRQLDLCVWTKGQPGMGLPYRQMHELVAVFKRGTRQHVQNIDLGKHGRNRSNVWPYSSGPSFSAARQKELSAHPTCKPLTLVQDAILDATHREEIVLDAFGGSGTTLIAAEQCGRKARLIEIDPYYCDTIIRRFEALTGEIAHTSEGVTLSERVRERDAMGGETAHG